MYFRHRGIRIAGVKHPQRGFVGFLPAAVGAQEHGQFAVHLHQLEGDAVGGQIPGGDALFYGCSASIIASMSVQLTTDLEKPLYEIPEKIP